MSHGGTLIQPIKSNNIALENICRKLWVIRNELFNLNDELLRLDKRRQNVLAKKSKLENDVIYLDKSKLDIILEQKLHDLSRKFALAI